MNHVNKSEFILQKEYEELSSSVPLKVSMKELSVNKCITDKFYVI